MGSSILKTSVPFKTETWNGDGDDTSSAPAYIQKLLAHDENETVFTEQGWTFVRNKPKSKGPYSEVYPSLIKKDDLIVYWVNESPYASGGDIELSFFADSQETLNKFLSEVMPNENYKIKANQAVVVVL